MAPLTDGYTFLLAASGPILIAGTLYSKLNYNPAADFTAVSPQAPRYSTFHIKAPLWPNWA